MRRLLIILAALALFTACGPSDVGQACQGGALEDDCVEGAICTPDQDDRTPAPEDPNDYSYTCRTVCDGDADCEAGFSCQRVVGSMLSSCQPTGETPASDAGTP